jgi:hypothetical protein
MSVLKVSHKEENQEETKYVGAQLSRQVFDYLTLYALSQGITKTIVLRNTINSWFEGQSQTEQELVKVIIKKARIQQRRWTSDKPFKIKLKADLERRGICNDYVEMILKAL